MNDRLRFVNEGSSNELDELLGAYALDAVEPEEAARIEDYLASNPRAAAEVQEHREIATMLAFTGMDAPDGVWERITEELDGIDEGGPSGTLPNLLPPVGAPEPAPAVPAPPAPSTEADTDDDNVVPFRRRRVSTFLMGAAAAAVVAVGAVIVTDSRASAPDDPIAEAYEVALDADGSQQTELVAEGSDVVATGVVASDGQGFLDARDLPSLSASQTYQLWGVLAETGDVVSIGIIGADPALEVFTVDESVAALAITIEDAPGVVADGNPDGAYVGAFA